MTDLEKKLEITRLEDFTMASIAVRNLNREITSLKRKLLKEGVSEEQFKKLIKI